MYTKGEEIVNSATHGVGALLAIVGGMLLIHKAQAFGGAAMISCAIYGAALFALYMMSSLYHAVQNPTAKGILRIFDHCTIFLLITGTYAPYTVISLGGMLGHAINAALCICTILGIVLNAVSIERFKRVSMILYVLMGWCIVVAVVPLLQNLPMPGFGLLLAGGVVYTAGILFYKMKRKKYMHSVWHAFVLGGSVLQFFSIYFFVLS